MNGQKNYLDYLKSAPQQIVSSQNPNGFINNSIKPTKKKLDTINKDIQNITNNILGSTNIPAMPNIEIPDENINATKLIKNSSLNDILNIDDYQMVIKDIKQYISKTYGNSWYANDIKNSNIFTGLLEEASEIIKILFPLGTNIKLENINIEKILDKLAKMFFYIFLIFIHEGDEMSIYSLLNSYIKLSEDTNFNRDKGAIFYNSWDTLVLPIAIKQPHLILIKLLDFWFGLDSNWKILKTRFKIILLDNSNV